MKNVSLEELLEAGCHFGHQVARQNPKAKEFIFEARDSIHIIDLAKTKECLEEAGEFVKNIAKRNGTLLVVGTKRQAESVLKEEIKRAQTAGADGLHFVTKRWIGGTLTNAPEVAKNYKKLTDIGARLQDKHVKARYTKKEIGDWEKSRVKLDSFYSGIVDMKGMPDAVFVIDTHTERVSVQEATRMHVPTVGITDTNSDPSLVEYPIPANDDAVGSLKLIIGYIMDAWIEGKKLVGTEEKVEEKKETVKKKEVSAEPKEEKAPKKGEKTVAKKKETATSDKPAAKAKKATTKKEEKTK